MNTRKYVESLFSGYEQTDTLTDFKEELESNLNDRIDSLEKKGLNEQEAYDKATAELGDVSALADDLNLKRKQQVLSEMYMKTRNYIKPRRMAFYVLCGSVLGFVIVTGIIVWLFSKDIRPFFGPLLFFGEVSVLGLIFLGLTQETGRHEGLSWKRTLWYVGAVGIFLLGILLFVMTYFVEGAGLPHAVMVLISFALPGLALNVFLILTEKDRSKPWVTKLRRNALEREMQRFESPAEEERFGIISGALWIGAIAVFAVLLIVGILRLAWLAVFSWLVLVAAVIIQMLVLSTFSKQKK